MQSGVFTISLDFELHWGGFEKWELNDAKKEYFKNTRALIPSLLLGFQQFEVHVTWATVGLLMHKNKESLLAHVPERKPSYSNEQLSAYNFIQNAGSIGASEKSDPYHFADSLIRLIVDSKYQELASHSFAHYYCNEPGQTTEQFDADCKAICESASAYNSELKSLVFPEISLIPITLRYVRKMESKLLGLILWIGGGILLKEHQKSLSGNDLIGEPMLISI